MLFPSSSSLCPVFHWISTYPSLVVLHKLATGAILALKQLPLKQFKEPECPSHVAQFPRELRANSSLVDPDTEQHALLVHFYVNLQREAW